VHGGREELHQAPDMVGHKWRDGFDRGQKQGAGLVFKLLYTEQLYPKT
jgi:hypothetical protein